MKNPRFKVVIFVIVFILGASVFIYPLLGQLVNMYSGTAAVESYKKSVDKMQGSDVDTALQEAGEYNEALGEITVIDPFAETQQDSIPSYYDLLDIGECMGYIEIPKINISLPIYHSVSEQVLQNAIGHIESSSLPVGGESTHCVLTGHNGLPDAELFTNLDKLEIGDSFYINVMNTRLTYKVCMIEIVEPEDVSLLQIEQGKDLCTLVTCTPYMVNSHRLLVRGERVEDEDYQPVKSNLSVKYIIIISLIIMIFTSVSVLIAKRKK